MTQLDLDHPIHDQIDTYRTATASEVPPDVRDYYDGKQPPVVSQEQMAALGDRANRPMIENMLQRCVDSIAGRLLFEQYVCESDESVQEALNTFAMMNHLSQRMVANTVRALVDGNSAISLAWNDRPVIYQEPWWDGSEGMYVETNENGIEEWAVKEWTDREKRQRRTVYLPGQIIRYVKDGTAWQPFPDENTHIQPWVRSNGEPLGVPVIHFANSGSAATTYGESKLEPLLGLQDTLNGSLFDIAMAQAMTAAGIYTATGVKDSEKPLHVGPGTLWRVEDKDAEFGVLSGVAMTSLLDGYQTIRTAISSQFPVADHIISGNWPSGMALIKAESQMVAYVKLLGEAWAPDYVRLAHRATEMMNAFGGESLDEDALIRIAYQAPEQLDDSTIAEIDQVRVQTYRELAQLPKTLMVKSRVVDADEAEAISNELQSMTTLIADAGF